MDPFVIIKALHIAVLVIIGGALYAFWHQSDRKNPFLLHWSIYEVALAAILFATGHPPFSQIAAGVAVAVLLLGTLHYRNKRPPPRAAFFLLFLAIALPAYGLGRLDSAYGTVYLTTAIGIAYMAAAALFVREGGWLNVFIGVVFVGRTVNALLYQVWVAQDMLYMVYVTGQVLATLSGVGLLLAGFARAYGQLQQRERELVSAYNQSEELMLRLELRNEEYLRARHAAEAANAAKTQFLANMSHELRTPLNAILGFSEVMQVLPKEKIIDKVGLYARNIHDAASGLQAIISDILNLSRIEAGAIDLQPQACDLDDLLAEIRRLLQPLADQKGITLSHNAGGPCLAWGDRRLTRQALINGLSNAIKYTPRGGTVTCSAAIEGSYAVATVEDTGIGIGRASLSKAFEPFWQEGNTFVAENTGVGLGLSIAKSYVEAQGGRIELKPARERGTIFRISLPLPAAEPDAAPAASAAS